MKIPYGTFFSQMSQGFVSQIAFLRSSSFPCHDPTMAQWGMKSQEMGASFKKTPSSLMRHWEETATESDKIPL